MWNNGWWFLPARLYKQRLIADRIAWTTLGVFEVYNEIRAVVRVNNGKVSLKGSFLGFRDPSILKHKVAEIEGAVDIKINAAFLARSSGTEGGAGVNPQRA